MILDIVKSIDGVPIRLTEERWYEHIVEKRPYMSGYLQKVLDAVYYPEFILRGYKNSKIAVLNIGYNEWLHVVYVELSTADGFINSAYIKSNYNKYKVIWNREF